MSVRLLFGTRLHRYCCPCCTLPRGHFAAGCRDQAGNFASRFFALKYDATPPVVSELRAAGLNQGVALSWRTSADIESVEVVRTPAWATTRRPPCSAAGPKASSTGASQTASATPTTCAPTTPPATPPARPPSASLQPQGQTLRRPARPLRRRGARARGAAGSSSPPSRSARATRTPAAAPLDTVRGAGYYNLQLWRHGRKILSVWPALPRCQLKRRWRYGGRSWRLEPGRYRWFVWPGFWPALEGRLRPADWSRQAQSAARSTRLSASRQRAAL
jgi:hypothetical protein